MMECLFSCQCTQICGPCSVVREIYARRDGQISQSPGLVEKHAMIGHADNAGKKKKKKTKCEYLLELSFVTRRAGRGSRLWRKTGD